MKLLHFTADWCGPCKVQSQIIKNAGDKITVQIEDVNIDDNLFMAQDFQVRGVPTMVLVDNEQKEIKRHVGVLKEDDLIEFLKG